VSAARLCARVLLRDRGPTLGGHVAHALVHTFCGLFLPADSSATGGAPAAAWAHDGFPRAFALGLQAAGGAASPETAGRVVVLPIYPPAVELHAARVCAGEPALTCWLGAEAVSADLAAAARDASTVEVVRAGARVRVAASIVVDTTGDGTVAALGGAATAIAAAHELQCPSFIFRVAGAAPRCVAGFARLQLSVAAAGAVRAGDLPAGCESVMLRPGAAPDEVYVTLNVARPERYDPLNEAAVADLESDARARAQALVAYLRGTRPAFAQSRVLAWPRRLGIRETRRLEGRVSMTAADVLAGRRRDDGVAVSTWPIELWRDHRRAHFEYPAGPSSIPLGALISRSHPRLGMAGRCMSASHEALGALRVIGTAMATGEAIGVAAALAADRGTALATVAPADVRARIRALAER
jgi:hypothetical protein